MNACNSTGFVALLLAAVGCAQARFAQTAENPQDASAAAAADCPAALVNRISITEIDLSEPLHYKRSSYDYFPRDDRIALSVDADTGTARVAWLDADRQNVHVTPLNAKLQRMAADTVLPGHDIGGLAARKDGFALLTRAHDPGAQLIDPNSKAVADAALLIRKSDGNAGFSAALTGTASITQASNPMARDCAPLLSGRLIWNGAKYGAYFPIHGCTGDPHASQYGDKLVYIDDSGSALSGGWSWNCSIVWSLRLWAEPDAFTSLCLSDNMPAKGLNLMFSDVPSKLLAPEAATDGWVGGQFGSVVRMGDGTYVVTWTSRSVDSKGQAAKAAPDIAVIRLGRIGNDFSVIEPMRWLRETPDIAELNLHMAPYGRDRLLLIWDEMDSLVCPDAYTCFGNYTGTHARLLDATAHFLSTDTTIIAVPNTEDDISVLPNGDLAWAFVQEDARSYSQPLFVDSQGDPLVPDKSAIQIARVKLCGDD